MRSICFHSTGRERERERERKGRKGTIRGKRRRRG